MGKWKLGIGDWGLGPFLPPTGAQERDAEAEQEKGADAKHPLESATSPWTWAK
jgi:hypothetical protein